MWNRFFLAAIFLVIVSSVSLSHSQIDANYVLGSPNLNAWGTLPFPIGVYMSSSSGKVFISDQTLILRFPNSALTTDGALPEAVLGTPGICDNGGIISLFYISIDESDSLWGADPTGNRVFKADSISSASDLSFSLILGQNSFTDCDTYGDQLNQMNGPFHALVDPTKDDLWVADSYNNRVLRFNNASYLTRAANATTFLGTGSSGTSAAALSQPVSIALDPQGRLYVADSLNRRVVRFDDAHNLESGAEASFVLGQPDFTTSYFNEQATQSSFSYPLFVSLFDDVLYISDNLNSRALIFSDVSTLQNGANATSVLGQSNFNSNQEGGITPFSISYPHGIYCDSDSLLVASAGENRVLRYDMPLPPFSSPSSVRQIKANGAL